MTQLGFKRTKRLPVIMQEQQHECAHACVCMVAQYWGHGIDLSAIRRIQSPSTRGTSLATLVQVAATLQLQTRALRVPVEEVKHIPTPAIIFWEMNHFVVLKKVRKNRIVIHDPGVGLKILTLSEFTAAYSGIVLELAPEDSFKPLQSQEKLRLSSIVRLTKGIKRVFAWVLVLSTIVELLALISPLFIQYVTDHVLATNQSSNLLVITLLFFCLMGFHALTQFIRGNVLIYITYNLTEQFSSFVVGHLLKLPLRYFEVRHKGDIQSKVQAVGEIQKKLSTDFISTLLDGLMASLCVSVLFSYNIQLAGLVVFFLFLSVLLRYTEYYVTQPHLSHAISKHASAISSFLESLHGIMTIKLFSKERDRTQLWRNQYIHALNSDIALGRCREWYGLCRNILDHTESILIIAMGAQLVLHDALTLGMFMAFLGFRLSLSQKAVACMQSILEYKLLKIQLDRVGDIIFQTPESLNSQTMPIKDASITIKNLSFRYAETEPFLFENLNLSVKPGEKIAITGPSGCGKTSLLKLIMGLNEASTGEIQLGGIPIQVLGMNNVRASVACVMQADSLLSGSILDNITFFDSTVDLAAVHNVATIASIHEDILSFPMGYHTQIGDMGSSLSGGQKQRILLARALYKRPKVLILDEASSHLDTKCERQINQALKALDITQVIVAHREETIRMADRVIELV